MRDIVARWKDPLVKGLTELARVAVLAALPIVLMALESGEWNWEAIGLAVAIAVLRALDKILHKYGEQNGNTVLERGITQF